MKGTAVLEKIDAVGSLTMGVAIELLFRRQKLETVPPSRIREPEFHVLK